MIIFCICTLNEITQLTQSLFACQQHSVLNTWFTKMSQSPCSQVPKLYTSDELGIKKQIHSVICNGWKIQGIGELQ